MASRYRTEEDAVKDKKVSVKLKEESKEDKQYYTPEDRKIIYPNLK